MSRWHYPTSIHLAPGAIQQLPKLCQEAGMHRPLCITDRQFATLPIIAHTLQALQQQGIACELFSDLDSNPTELDLEKGIDYFRSGQHDGIVAIGGGSALDTGKLIALMAHQSIAIWELEDREDWYTRANADCIAPIIAIPTTSGTGAETGRAAVITRKANCMKTLIFHPKMMPQEVICDPELTISMPPAVTAGSGIDALIHNLEAYCALGYHPMADGIALEAMRLIKTNLPRAYHKGEDLEARTHMMAASIMGAAAFQKGVGVVHSLSHPIGAMYHTHHGTTNAVFLLPVLHFNRKAIEERIERAAGYLDITGGFDGFCDWLAQLCERLHIPNNLPALGVHTPDIARVAELALNDPSTASNPVPVSVHDLEKLIQQAMG